MKQLTPREAEVLKLIADGHMNKEIADKLGISIKTVEKHRHKVLNKTGIHDAVNLTHFAIRKGLVKLKTF